MRCRTKPFTLRSAPVAASHIAREQTTGDTADRRAPLRLFIETHHGEIIQNFETFARTLMPPDVEVTAGMLRDHAEELLTAITRDMSVPQSAGEQERKSEGLVQAHSMEASGQLHADARVQQGFTLQAIVAEFRALRATILRLYENSGGGDLAEVRRFNEAVDEALAVSLRRFAVQTDLVRDQSVGILSHDLRTPLDAFTSGAALLALPEDNPERRARVAARMLQTAHRMGRLIADLLDLTRVRLGGRIPLTLRQTDLQQICEEVTAENGDAHPGAIVRLETRGNLTGAWDADRLAQVISNLLGNAIQHRCATEITLRASEERNAVTLAVHNGGPPIPARALPLVFEPLARGESEAGPHSIGLGLFIAREVVEAHGGHIEVISSTGAGTTFTVSLPKNGHEPSSEPH